MHSRMIQHELAPGGGEGAIKVTMGIIKKFRMWRTCYIADKSESCLVFLAFKALPYDSGIGLRSSAMGFGSKTALLLLVSFPIIGWSGISFAYRPFDSTDAAVADVGQLEVEFGPVQFRRSNEEQTVI